MTLKGKVIRVTMHFCLANHSQHSPRIISAQMRIYLPFFSQLQAWSDQVLADAQ
jgi:hypothetical protein